MRENKKSLPIFFTSLKCIGQRVILCTTKYQCINIFNALINC